MKPDSTFRTSTARLAMLYGAVVLLLVVVLQSTVYLLAREALHRELRNIVTTDLQSLTEEFDAGGIEKLSAELRSRSERLGRIGAVYLLVNESRERLAGNLSWWPIGDPKLYGGREVRFSFRETETGSRSHPVWAKVVELPGYYWLLVGSDISESESSMRRFGLATIWGITLIAVLMGVMGWWFSRHTARRVRDISATCDSIVHSDLSQRLHVGQRSDEFDQLSTTVNNMLARLEEQAGMLRTTFGSIAHDLRTPLYRLRVRLEEGLLNPDIPPAARELMAPALEELDRVQRTLGTLLEIARAESGEAARAQEQVDLAALAREMHELYQPGMQERGLQLRLAAPDTAPVAGQRQLLAQLVANLLENALKYVPAGSEVVLSVRGDAARAILEVADNGPGIAAADRERAQRPFVRLQDRSSGQQGSGLGLSLVRAIVRLHRGEVELQDNQPGLRVVCAFPRWRAGKDGAFALRRAPAESIAGVHPATLKATTEPFLTLGRAAMRETLRHHVALRALLDHVVAHRCRGAQGLLDIARLQHRTRALRMVCPNACVAVSLQLHAHLKGIALFLRGAFLRGPHLV
jgi:signal transduction histidine kinase